MTPPPPGPIGRPPRTLSLLSSLHGSVGATRPGRALLHALQVRRFARLWLRTAILDRYCRLPDDVTVLIGVRDRTDHRLPLALRSIREQTLPADRVHILVVDYGSEPAAADFTAERCRLHGAQYVRVDTAGVWSRSRCLNIGIRQTTTKYLLTSDVDILFSPAYIAEAVDVLREAPLSVVCSAMLDLPEDTTAELQSIGESGGPLRLARWRNASTPRLDWAYHPSITMTYSAFHHLIRGYDEFFEVWGREDADLLRRLLKLGLDRRTLDAEAAFYLHQWHPKYENLPDEGREQASRRNTERWRQVQTILRNGADWGATA
jgi:GT2 family glycosyltransferase